MMVRLVQGAQAMRRSGRHFVGARARCLLVVVAVLAAVGAAAPAQASGGGAKDFSICCNDSSTPGFLVVGGLATCPAFDNCAPNPSFEPRYFSCGFSSCGYGNASVVLTSLNGFSGTVSLQMLNLPAGVTSLTATSVTLATNATAYTDFTLQAASNAVPGDYLVTVRATSGTLVHDAQHLIRVVEQLPPPLLTPTFSPSTVPGGTSSTGTVALAGPAPPGGAVVSILNGSPSVATTPATVTIPAGQTSATFTVTTTAVSATTYVSINANYQTVIYPIGPGTLTVSP
jgi:hypothetical protein